MSHALSFEKVVFAYPGPSYPGPPRIPVLAGLDLSVAEGEIAAVLGPNGVGKSTLLALGLGWLSPATGVVRLFGEPLRALSRAHLGRSVALVPQSEYIPFDFTVAEYALLGRAPYLRPLESPKRKDLGLVEEVLEEVGISDLKDRSVTELSAGERQLLLLARALSQEPRLLLLDEPSSHLDLANKQKLLHVLTKRVRGGLTALFTTHDPQFAAALATSVCLMKSGQLSAVGAPETVLTAAKLSDTYGVAVDVQSLDGEPVVIWHRQQE